MDRYWKSDTGSSAPVVPASNAGGFPVDGIPSAGVRGTVPGAWWYHAVTEEIRNAILALGITPDWTKTDQLATVVSAIAAALGVSSDAGNILLAGTDERALLTVDGIPFSQTCAGAISRTMLAKAREIFSIADTSTLAQADATARTVYVPAGVWPVTQNVTLTSCYRFERGAMLQPAQGVTVTFAAAYLDASDYQQIFDLSKGGALAGVIANRYHSAVWFGADFTGKVSAGAAIQAAFSTRLTFRPKIPAGVYDCTGTQLVASNIHLLGDDPPSGQPNQYDGAVLLWKQDMGAGAAALTFTNSANYFHNPVDYRNLRLIGPGQKGAATGVAGCLMDGVLFGTGQSGAGGSLQFSAENMRSEGFRFGFTANTLSGHCRLRNLTGGSNYATWCMLQTGGDWKWENCVSGGDQRAAFYLPRNGNFGVHGHIDTYFCAYTPYFVFQDTALDSRLPGTTTVNAVIASLWSKVSCERLGNAFINLTPTDSSIYQLKLEATGWDSLLSNAPFVAGEPQDYAIKVGYIEGLDLNDDLGSGGAGTLAPFNVGVIQVQNAASRGISACRIHNIPPAGKTFLSGSTSAKIIPQTYHLPQVTIPAGQTSVQYTAADYEACSRGNWFITLWSQQNLGTVSARATTAGSVVTVSLSAALAFDVTFTINLYEPGI
ncbi:hypothetical protein V4C53_11700 [Paraburkholderia azotifigens]|uniref:hypothetical protein n=1 Tax=Paraburkholderia azotifigens TaxID=2057004 RepID=UPI003171A4EB